MGALFDYFRAPDDASVIAALRDSGGSSPVDVGPCYEGLALKHVTPHVLGQLVALIDGGGPGRADGPAIWPEDPLPATRAEFDALPYDSSWNTGPWLEALPGTVVDVLAAADDARVPGIGRAWAAAADLDEEWLVELAADFVALARRTRAAGERLYLWSSL